MRAERVVSPTRGICISAKQLTPSRTFFSGSTRLGELPKVAIPAHLSPVSPPCYIPLMLLRERLATN